MTRGLLLKVNGKRLGIKRLGNREGDAVPLICFYFESAVSGASDLIVFRAAFVFRLTPCSYRMSIEASDDRGRFDLAISSFLNHSGLGPSIGSIAP